MGLFLLFFRVFPGANWHTSQHTNGFLEKAKVP
jgi:hypothetical protein